MSQSVEIEVSPPPVTPRMGLCAHCGGAVDVRTRHLAIEGSAVRVFCSADCAAARPQLDLPPPPPRRSTWRKLAPLAVGVPMLVFTSGQVRPVASTPAAIIRVAAPAVKPEPPMYGPAWPPTEKDWMAEIATDGWIHPLDGPKRRMPIRDARVFGAERPGDRPPECRSGHCGVDIGGEVWGEPVHCVHDGVVDRVQRGPNEDHGGLYVRIAHRGGTIFTQYFHLAAIPRWIQPGVKVKMGEVIGLLGDSGVKHSRCHLHFTVSVKPSADVPERFIDPEPLIALWPLRMPVSGGAMLATSAAPGVPLGAAGRPRSHRAKHHANASPPTAEVEDDATASE